MTPYAQTAATLDQLQAAKGEDLKKALLAKAYRQANANLLPFCRLTKRDYQPSRSGIHDKIADALERVSNGLCKRLMVFVPRRFGKSELAAVRFPLWHLGRHPEQNVAIATYAESLALKHSRTAIATYASPTYSRIFPGVAPETRTGSRLSSGEWTTQAGGGYYAVGVGGAIVGRGVDVGIIDDVYKDRPQANSPAWRETVKDWYNAAFYPTLSPNAAVIMILTRWHPLDIAADRLKDMETGDGDQWEIIEIPALNDEDGDKPSSNWPERWPVRRLMQTKRVIGSYEWSALYQQNPTIRGGNILQAENIKIHTNPEDFPKTKYYRAWDLASTAKQRSKDNPDFTVGTLGCMTTEKDPATGADIPHLWIKHAVFMQEEAPRRDQKILTTTDADGPGVTVIVESYAAYKDAYTTLKDTLRGTRIVKGRAYKMDKLSKVSPAEPIFEAGNVHVMAGAWLDEWQKQHLEFTGLDGGAHDDAVDTTGLIVREYRKARSGLAMG